LNVNARDVPAAVPPTDVLCGLQIQLFVESVPADTAHVAVFTIGVSAGLVAVAVTNPRSVVVCTFPNASSVVVV